MVNGDYPDVLNWRDARTGSLRAWRHFASTHGITYPANATRMRIIVSVQKWIRHRDARRQEASMAEQPIAARPIGQYRATIVITGDDLGTEATRWLLTTLIARNTGHLVYVEDINRHINNHDDDPTPAPSGIVIRAKQDAVRDALGETIDRINALGASGLHGQVMRTEVLGVIAAIADSYQITIIGHE